MNHGALAKELHDALRNRVPLEPLEGRVDGLSIKHAYRISRSILDLRLAEGEVIIGKKIGVTSAAVQNMLGVHQPDFGYLTDAMRYPHRGHMPISKLLIQPRAEGEIAFTLAEDLVGPGITPEQVLAATEQVFPCFEVVDSRIKDWQIGIYDTIADNASSGLFIMGEGVDPQGVDFENCRMRVHKNGALLSEGKGSAALGSPLNCVAWLGNTMGRFGVPLKAGEIILSGSLVPLESVQAGDHMQVHIEGIGETEVFFT